VRIFVPGDAAAVAVGADNVAAAVGDGVIRNGSRGMFELEPLLEVETPEGRMGYARVTAGDVRSLGPDHPKCVGLVDELPFLKRQTRLTFARCGITDPRSIDEYRAHGGFKGLARAVALGPAATVEEVLDSGLRGRGGAGFPAGIKWRTAAAAPAAQKYIVCNADEGDSGTFADRMVMEGDPFMLIEGMAIAGFAAGATQGYIYIRSEYPHAIRAMGRAIGTARNHGLLGPDFDIEVRVGAGA
jgi:formate dehydrogenase iron-sulfur subunit